MILTCYTYILKDLKIRFLDDVLCIVLVLYIYIVDKQTKSRLNEMLVCIGTYINPNAIKITA